MPTAPPRHVCSRAQAQFDVASNQVDYAVLRASRDGVIARRSIEVGQVVAAGQTAFVLAADGEREVAINLPEQALERYRIGQEVEVELWSQPGRRYAGQIRELSPAADPNTGTYSARVAFSDQDVPADLGQSALVTVRRAAKVPLAVPLSAISAEARADLRLACAPRLDAAAGGGAHRSLWRAAGTGA
ncbi:hypothetical protein SSTU70S_01028 [Stutzerimonas stutzeri]